MNRPENPILHHTRVVSKESEPQRWMLVLHGIYGNGRNWATIARRLVERRPEWGLLLVDLRMHGGSAGFAPPHTLRAAAADVDALVEHLGLAAAAVLGHSFGGKVALMYAQHHGAELRQAWVVDSTLEVREPSGSVWRMIGAVRALPSEFTSRQEAVQGLVEQGYSAAVANWMAMNLEPSANGYRWRLDFDGVEQMLRDYFRTDLWEVVESPPAEVEVHVVKALDSDALDEDDAARIERAGQAGGLTYLHPVEGGHWINTDNPEAVLDLLAGRLP